MKTLSFLSTPTYLATLSTLLWSMGAAAAPSWVVYRNPVYQGTELSREGIGQIIQGVEFDPQTGTLKITAQNSSRQQETLAVQFANPKSAKTAAEQLHEAINQGSGLSMDLSGCVNAVPLYETDETIYSKEMRQRVSCRRIHYGFTVKCAENWWVSTPLTQIPESSMRSDSPHSGSLDFHTTLECPDEDNYYRWGKKDL